MADVWRQSGPDPGSLGYPTPAAVPAHLAPPTPRSRGVSSCGVGGSGVREQPPRLAARRLHAERASPLEAPRRISRCLLSGGRPRPQAPPRHDNGARLRQGPRPADREVPLELLHGTRRAVARDSERHRLSRRDEREHLRPRPRPSPPALGLSRRRQGHVESGPRRSAALLRRLRRPSLRARRPGDGRLVWRGSAGSRVYGTVAVARGRVFAPSVFSGMSALSARTGRLLWRIPIGAYTYSSPAVYRGRVYFGTYEGLVYSVDARSGKIFWTRPAGGAVSGAVQVVNGVVYAGSLGSRITAWQWRSGRPLSSSPHGRYVAVSGNGSVLLMHGGGAIWGVVLKTQAMTWRRILVGLAVLVLLTARRGGGLVSGSHATRATSAGRRRASSSPPMSPPPRPGLRRKCSAEPGHSGAPTSRVPTSRPTSTRSPPFRTAWNVRGQEPHRVPAGHRARPPLLLRDEQGPPHRSRHRRPGRSPGSTSYNRASQPRRRSGTASSTSH